MTDAEYLNWLARDNSTRCVLVELDYQYENGGAPATGTLYLSDRAYFDDDGASPLNVYIDCVNSVPQFNRALSGDRLGAYTSSVGTLEIDNADGEQDFFFELAIDGSEVRFYVGDLSWPKDDFRLIYSALASVATAPSFDRVSVALKDTGLLLNQSIGGTSLVGGSGPNANQARPVNFGYVHNLQALVLDAGLLRYVYADDGTDTTVADVRDRGVSVVFTDNFDGTFDLSASPDGAITCDVVASPGGSDSPSLDNRCISDAMNELVGIRSGLIVLDRYRGAGSTFNVHDDDDYLIGISLPEARNVIDLLSDIVDSGNCFWSVLRTGEFSFGRLRPNDIAGLVADSGSPQIPVTQILEDDIDEGSFRLDHSTPLYYQYQAYMSRNWFVQTDLASSLTPDEQAVWTRKGIYLLQAPGVGTTYNDAPELYNKSLTVSPVVDTLLSGGFDELDLPFLEIWMDTRREMFLPWIEIVSITVGLDFYELELGDVVSLVMPRFGEDDGTLFQVMAINLRLSQAKVDLRLVRRRLLAPPPDDWLRITDPIDDPPFPSELGKLFIPPSITTDPPPFFPIPGYPIGVRGGGDGIAFFSTPIAQSHFFRPGGPDPDGYLVIEPTGFTTGHEGDPSFFNGDYWQSGDSDRFRASLSFQASIPTIATVPGQLVVIDSDGKFEFSGVCDAGPNFAAPAFAIPAYSWEVSGIIDLNNYEINYIALNDAGGMFDRAVGTYKIFALKFWANRQQYIAYGVSPQGTTAGGAKWVGVTTNSDIRGTFGAFTTPTENAPGDGGPWDSARWTDHQIYRMAISSLPKNETVLVSGPSITSPFSGMLITATKGSETETVSEDVPANDNFASAVNFTLGPVTNQAMPTVSNQNATTEGSEPCSTGTATKTVWWAFKPGANGNISLSTLGSFRSDDGSYSNPLNTVLTLYTGSAVGSLTQVAGNDDGGTDVTSAIGSTAVTSGVQYHVQVSVKSGTSQYGAVKLKYTCDFAMAPPPPVITNTGGTALILPFPLAHSTTAITPFQITATNSPTSYGASGMPAGLSINTSTGQITGTPTSSGSGSFNITATNAGGTSSPGSVAYFFT